MRASPLPPETHLKELETYFEYHNNFRSPKQWQIISFVRASPLLLKIHLSEWKPFKDYELIVEYNVVVDCSPCGSSTITF